MEASACACLVELMSAALMLQARAFFSERVQLMLRSQGRAKTLVADSWPEGDIRGILDISDESMGGPWIQAPGIFKVMRSNPRGKPYIGTLELIDGPIQSQLENYLLQSEQISSSATIWCDAATGEAGALLVEPMPKCPRERLENLIHAIEGLEVVPHWERKPEFLCRWINQGDGTEILSSTEVNYRCRCSKDSLVDILRGFVESKRNELFQEGRPVDVRCDYCGKTYQIGPSEMTDLEKGLHAES